MKKTKKTLEFFKKCCLDYANKFEMNNWTFRFYWMEKDDMKKFDGGFIHRSLDNCGADIYLDPRHTTEEEIRRTAKHEIIHCIVGKLYMLGRLRYITEADYDREEEELVHKLEKLL